MCRTEETSVFRVEVFLPLDPLGTWDDSFSKSRRPSALG